jgi:beta-glucanase (GH16 family)
MSTARLPFVLFAMVMLTAAFAPSAHAQWSDEFNGSGAVDPGTWTYDVGGGGWGNAELEYYQSGTGNVNQANGYVEIQARQQSVGGMAYTSGRIKTQGIKTFQQGYKVEARLRGPMGQGFWPAFWALGSDITTVPWPGCGEIDIMEHINSIPNNVSTIHWIDNNGVNASYTAAQPAMTFTDWNTYGLEWNSSLMRFTLNGAYVGDANIAGAINGTDEFGPGKPFFIIMNLAVGGSWPGSPDGSTVFPANLDVDWLHVTNMSVPTPTATTAATATATPVRATATATAARATATATTSGTGNCAGVAAFATCTAYANGAKVVYNNTLYHSIVAIPSTRDCPPNSPFNPSNDNWWVNDGACSGGGATATATPTAAARATATATTAGATATRTNTPTATATPAGGWNLVWSDEFNGTGVPSSANWNYHVGNGYNAALPGFQGWGNGEWEWYRPENSYQSGGNLVIRADYNSAPTSIAGSNWYQRSGRITTQGKHSWTYGKIEARIQMPNITSTWPAFWMMGDSSGGTFTSNSAAPITYYDSMATNWASCGEVDIVEHKNSDALIYNNIFWDLRTGVFPWTSGENANYGTTYNVANVAQFHVYSIEWDATYIKWFTDGVQTHIIDITPPTLEEFHKPMYLILNLAVAGAFPATTPNIADFPTYMYVDYVRVYQK